MFSEFNLLCFVNVTLISLFYIPHYRNNVD